MENTEIQIKDKAQLRAFQMKFEGFKYEEIANDPVVKGKYEQGTLENYFIKGGMWYEAYQSWRDWKKEQIEEEVKDIFVAQAHNAARAMINISKGVPFRVPHGDGEIPVAPKAVHLQANQDILDRSGFVVIKKMEVESKSEDVADETIKKLKDMKAKKLAEKRKAKKQKKNDKK